MTHGDAYYDGYGFQPIVVFDEGGASGGFSVVSGYSSERKRILCSLPC